MARYEEEEEQIPGMEKGSTKPVVKKNTKERVVVVKELPTQQVRTTMDEDGETKIIFMTTEEALAEIINK